MPDIDALTGYISERRIECDRGCGYSFVRELPPNIRDTYFGMSCLKMLREKSPDDEIVLFLSSYDRFDMYNAYYAMKCLKNAGAEAEIHDGTFWWCYHGEEHVRPCAIPATPLINYFKHDLYGMYGSSIFSSPLGAVLKRIELGVADLNRGLANSIYALLNINSRKDIMITYIALEMLREIGKSGYSVTLPSSEVQQIKAFLRLCTTRKGYVANPTTNLETLESTYAGHRVAQYLGTHDPYGIRTFIDTLQNQNGGFRRTQFGGISTLESCYLAISTITERISSPVLKARSNSMTRDLERHL